MTDTAYERRYERYTELVREIIARLGTKDGLRWIGARKALAHRSLVAFEEEWREECRLLDEAEQANQ